MEVKVCPVCGIENDKYFVICKHCGASLDNVPSAEPGAYNPHDGAQAGAGNAIQEKTENKIASALKVIAILTFIGGLILGCCMKDSRGDSSFVLSLICWMTGAVTGTMFLGFAEIVQLLHEINAKTKADK